MTKRYVECRIFFSTKNKPDAILAGQIQLFNIRYIFSPIEAKEPLAHILDLLAPAVEEGRDGLSTMIMMMRLWLDPDNYDVNYLLFFLISQLT